MKKILLMVFTIAFVLSCGAGKEGIALTPRPESFDRLNIVLSGGKDIDYVSSAKVEIISDRNSNEEGESIYEFSSEYGDAIDSLYKGYKAYVGDVIVISLAPSEAHKVVSVDLNGKEYNIENNKVSITIEDKQNLLLKGNFLKIKFEIKDEYLEEPIIVGDEYQITTAKELRWIASRGQRGVTFENKTIKLMNDIDMENIEFTGIATSGIKLWRFGGTFDGNGYKIENLKINLAGSLAGFIGVISRTGSVSNLTILGSIQSHGNYVGAIAGDNYGIIKNVTNKASVKGYSYVAGITGYNQGYIEKCVNDANITGEEYVAGITGLSDGIIIKDVINNGDIKGYKKIAKIGYYYAENTTIENAVANGTITENIHVSFDE